MKGTLFLIGTLAGLYALFQILVFVSAAVSSGGIADFHPREIGAWTARVLFSGAVAAWCLSNGLKRKTGQTSI